MAVGLFLSLVAGSVTAQETDFSRPDPDGTPTPVRINLYLADLHEVSGADQAFLADVVLQAEWNDPRLAGRWPTSHGLDLEDVWNPRLQLVNQRGASTLLPSRVVVEPSGNVFYRQRWWGQFSSRMDLKDFPLDRQRFHVQVVCMGYRRDEVELVAFPGPSRPHQAVELSITDWSIAPAVLEPADFEPAPGTPSLSGIRLAFEGRRQSGYYFVQVILPLVMIVIMGGTALWIDPSVVATRVSVSVTTMLTLIAYRFALGRMVPNLPYLTRFDHFTLGSTALVLLMLLVVVATAHLSARGRQSLVARVDWWARRTFPILFAATYLLLWHT